MQVRASAGLFKARRNLSNRCLVYSHRWCEKHGNQARNRRAKGKGQPACWSTADCIARGSLSQEGTRLAVGSRAKRQDIASQTDDNVLVSTET